jgi:putative transposase
MELKSTAHKVGINVHHLEWCTKYRYNMLKQDKYKKACEDAIRKQAARHKIVVRELFVMPEHVHTSCELPPSMSQSKALQLLKGGSSYLIFRHQPKFRLRYHRGHFWSPGAYAGSVGHNTVEVVDYYVRTQQDIHQRGLADFVGSPAPSEARSCEPQRATL